MASTLTAVLQQPRTRHTATIFMLHGLGDSGQGWAPTTQGLAKFLPHVKWVLPNAPLKPVTLNGGAMMPAWYDIVDLDVTETAEDEKGLLESMLGVTKLIRQEIDAGIPASRIVIVGFSQGGAVTLLTGLTSEFRFAGIVGLSTYLPLHKKIFTMASDANKNTPIFLCHGDIDAVVKYQFGQASAKALTNKGYKTEFNTYQNMSHSTSEKELKDVVKFLVQVLPPLKEDEGSPSL